MDAQPVDCGLLVRLADEGVPLLAIARSTRIPSSDLRQRLNAAKADGLLLELPHDDWPPGFPRDQRALQLSRLTRENKPALLLAMQRLFQLTPTQGTLLLMLVQKAELARPGVDTVARALDVHIVHIRKRLLPFTIQIQTLWGFGYRLNPADRHRVMDMILQSVAEPL